MLKINKILSKKIQFPLSLRGAKQRSNLKGFSLIELMVAVAILALAIFGIFHAYSTGFMGMADARAITVATNYAREAMEDIKNMDFDKIPTSKNSSVTINGKVFNRYTLATPQEISNLKEIITTVTWNDRNGNTKMVETNMIIHFVETTAGTPTRIMLVAEPYNVLTENIIDIPEIVDERKSTITAVVKDAKGNTVTTYSGEVTFSITVGDTYGNLQNNSNTYTVSSIKGIATTTFTASSKGEVVITASANGLNDDSVTIKITELGEAVKINLTNSISGVETLFMTPGTESTITATIVDAGGKTVDGANNEIFFEIYSGPGSLSTPTTFPASNGVANITLTSNDPPGGTITVTAIASGLDMGVVDVITGGQISLSVSNINIPVNETSIITVTTKDVDGVPMKYIGNIQLSIGEESTGEGNLSPVLIYFDGSSHSMTVNFTAGGTSGTIVNINAVDEEAGILTSADPLTLNIIQSLVPDHIQVSANPSSIQVDGNISTITAVIKTSIENGNVTVASYTDSITFTTTAGTFFNGENNITLYSTDDNYKGGEAKAVLYSSNTNEIAEIEVFSGTLTSGTVEVGFYILADNIHLIAYPQNILAGGDTCIITATIRDGDITITEYEGAVTFTIMEGYPSGVKFTSTNQSSITINALAGEAPITLQSKNWAGTAKIKAIASDGIPYLEQDINIPVGINLELIEDSVDYNIGIVSFDIDVQGAELLLEEMQVSWDVDDPVEALDKIDIAGITIYDSNPSNPVGSIFYTDTLNERVADIDVNDTTLSTGTSAIEMDFSIDMSGKTFEVIFNPNSGDYLVDLVPL